MTSTNNNVAAGFGSRPQSFMYRGKADRKGEKRQERLRDGSKTWITTFRLTRLQTEMSQKTIIITPRSKAYVC